MFHGKINNLALENNNYRNVIWTGENSQLVLMSIPVGEQIDEEVHHDVDQLLFFVEGMGEAILDKKNYKFRKGCVIVVPAGTVHTIINTGKTFPSRICINNFSVQICYQNCLWRRLKNLS